MSKIVTYQDYQIAAERDETERNSFIIKALKEYQSSYQYHRALTAQAYYARRNTGVTGRASFLERIGIDRSKVRFFKMKSGHFPKFVKQLNSYLLGNGATLPPEVKENLGDRFDKQFAKAGLSALVDGVSYIFWNKDRLLTYRATEFMPLFDEMTSDMMAGVRFWQIDPDKPTYMELYETDGITLLRQDATSLQLTEVTAKRAYEQTVRSDIIGSAIIDTANYPKIPVFPLYANDIHESELDPGFQENIDAYDFLSSELVDGAIQIDGVYWAITGYGGNDARELIKEIQQIKATYDDNDKAKVTGQSLEIPYNAKQAALELIERRMYADWMMPDNQLEGRAVTATEIKMSNQVLDLKADGFEYQCIDCLQNLLELLGLPIDEIEFKRRTLNNDSEMIDNLSKMLADGAIDTQFYVEACPLIPDDKQEELLERLALEEQEEAEEAFPIEDVETEVELVGE